MTLDEAVRHFRWDEAHDFHGCVRRDDKIVAIHGLGLYETDLNRLLEMVPSLAVAERHRVEHDHGTWLRVDVVEAT